MELLPILFVETVDQIPSNAENEPILLAHVWFGALLGKKVLYINFYNFIDTTVSSSHILSIGKYVIVFYIILTEPVTTTDAAF